jgi:PAS domain S-box-containing protein
MTFKWKYVWPYLIFAGTISVLVVINAVLIQKGVDHNMHFAHTINLAGRQRMLSQKAVSDVLIRANGNKSYDSAFAQLEHWNEVHHALVNGSVKYNLTRPTDKRLVAQLDALGGIQAALYKNLASTYTGRIDRLMVDSIVQQQAVYLPGADNVVYIIEQEAEIRFKEIRNQQIWTAFFSGLLLIVEIFVFVIPYHRKLVLAYQKLSSQKRLIEEQTEEIQQQMHSLAEQNTELEHMHRTEELTLAGINAGVWNWNIRTGEESWSANFFRILGYEPNEIPATFDTFLNILLHPDDKERVSFAIEKHLKENKPYQLNIRMHNKDGSYRWYETSGKASRGMDGQPAQMAGSIIDITEKVSYQNELELLNTTKDKLFTIIAHDLRSPINGLKTLLDLQMKGEIDITHDELVTFIKQFRNDIGFLSETLENILTWASSQMKGLKAQPVAFEMSNVLNKVEGFYRNVCKQKQISMELQLSKDDNVFADYEHIFIVMRNLVSNAIKFTPTGGKITIKVFHTDGVIKTTVTDTGIGLSKEQVEKIYDRKQHFSNFGTNNEKGTGLGLGLVFDLLTGNNGKLTLESEPGRGSSFTVTLPAQPLSV